MVEMVSRAVPCRLVGSSPRPSVRLLLISSGTNVVSEGWSEGKGDERDRNRRPAPHTHGALATLSLRSFVRHGVTQERRAQNEEKRVGSLLSPPIPASTSVPRPSLLRCLRRE
eukprot:s425_g12.t1